MLKRGIDYWRKVWTVGLRPGSTLAVVFALLCVVAATLVRLSLGLVSPDSAVFAPYYAATLVAVLVGGSSAGLTAATAGGIAGALLFVPPQWGNTSFAAEQIVSLLLFAISSAVIIWAAESYRALLQRLRHEECARQLLNHELAHRIKNVLGSVQAIVYQSLRDQNELRERIVSRIAALAATNDLLIGSVNHVTSLRGILVREFLPYDLYRFHLDGPDIECPSSVALLLALIIHEMTTNAAKYGALSRNSGRIIVRWTNMANRLNLEWTECGGPQPSEPTRTGFGTMLLRSAVTQFNGSTKISYDPGGLRVNLALEFPQDLVVDSAAGQSTDALAA